MEKQRKSARLGKYAAAAAATVAAGVASDASADLVTLPVGITAADSLEVFVDILPFASGASSISIATATSSFSVANPLTPNSELMIRGAAGFTGLRANNGAAMSYYVSGAFSYIEVGATPFVVPAAPNLEIASNVLTAYYDGYGGPIGVGATETTYFQFVNTGTGLVHDAWASFTTGGTAGDREFTLETLFVDTDPIPEPNSMGLLLLGAAGISAYRGRRRSA